MWAHIEAVRRLTSLEKMLLVGALAFITGGASALFHPREFTTLINTQGRNPITDEVYLHTFSKVECRICGALCIGCGFSLCVMAFYPWTGARERADEMFVSQVIS